MSIPFRGANRKIGSPTKWVAERDYLTPFPDRRIIHKGSLIMQFETINFGWTIWKYKDETHITKHE